MRELRLTELLEAPYEWHTAAQAELSISSIDPLIRISDRPQPGPAQASSRGPRLKNVTKRSTAVDTAHPTTTATASASSRTAPRRPPPTDTAATAARRRSRRAAKRPRESSSSNAAAAVIEQQEQSLNQESLIQHSLNQELEPVIQQQLVADGRPLTSSSEDSQAEFGSAHSDGAITIGSDISDVENMPAVTDMTLQANNANTMTLTQTTVTQHIVQTVRQLLLQPAGAVATRVATVVTTRVFHTGSDPLRQAETPPQLAGLTARVPNMSVFPPLLAAPALQQMLLPAQEGASQEVRDDREKGECRLEASDDRAMPP